jgi:hypothetical protein
MRGAESPWASLHGGITLPHSAINPTNASSMHFRPSNHRYLSLKMQEQKQISTHIPPHIQHSCCQKLLMSRGVEPREAIPCYEVLRYRSPRRCSCKMSQWCRSWSYRDDCRILKKGLTYMLVEGDIGCPLHLEAAWRWLKVTVAGCKMKQQGKWGGGTQWPLDYNGSPAEADWMR